MPRVVHFQIYVDDTARAEKFYREIFDWQLNQWEGDDNFWLVNTGDDSEPGINGGMLPRHEPAALTTTLVMQVPSIDDYRRPHPCRRRHSRHTQVCHSRRGLRPPTSPTPKAIPSAYSRTTARPA